MHHENNIAAMVGIGGTVASTFLQNSSVILSCLCAICTLIVTGPIAARTVKSWLPVKTKKLP